jgi:threonine dehydrogenase-like Zn-dependent dehydrogenase
MRADIYQGHYNVKTVKVADQTIQDKEDVIIKITSTVICGYNAFPLGAFFFISGNIDPTKIIAHKLSLEEANHAYRIFNNS